MGAPEPLGHRKLSQETCKKWSYWVGKDTKGKTVQIANIRNPEGGAVVAQKLRTFDKKFPWLGDPKEVTWFYGQWLWKPNGKRVIITEGELDALSVSQLFNNSWPVVSLVNGAQSAEKTIKDNLEWLDGFSQIVLCFDNDEPGREAVKKARKLLPPGKCYVVVYPDGIKDPSDALQQGRGKELVDALWAAQKWTPDGLVSGEQLLERIRSRKLVASCSYPWPILNEKTYGIRLGELDTWTSGTGMGKTTIIKALQYHFWQTTNYNQALIHLEEPLNDTSDDLVGYHLGARVRLPDQREKIGEGAIQRAEDELFLSRDAEGNLRFQLYDAFGSVEEDSLFSLIRYMATGLNCKIIWLDHLSILVSDSDEGTDERQKIDRIMHKLKSLTQELNIYIGLICHLKKAPQGKSFEEGYKPSLDDLRGSGGIKQLSNSVYAISRNQQATDPLERNTSTITVLKCRYTGSTGEADKLLFDEKTGRLVLRDLEDLDADAEY